MERPVYEPLTAVRSWIAVNKHRINQRELAARCDVAESLFSRYLSGERALPHYTALRLVAETGLPLDRFYAPPRPKRRAGSRILEARPQRTYKSAIAGDWE